jgi:hypothetical protein
MRVLHVNERIKEAPAQALRGMFAGIGQLLLVTDKLRNKGQEETEPAADAAQATSAPAAPDVPAASAAPAASADAAAAADAPAAAAEPAESGSAEPARDLDKTGNVRLLTDEDAGPEAAKAPAAKAPASKVKAKAKVPAAKAKAEVPAAEVLDEAPAGVDASASVSASASLPLPNYDELSVASLRARLRNLTAAQVGDLVAYEKANAARPEVIAMFERRIDKLAAESAS